MGDMLLWEKPKVSLDAMTMEELFDEAARYGAVGIWASPTDIHPNKYRATITFQTRQNTEMKAKSNFGMTVKSALIQVIGNAEDMVEVARGIQL